MVLQPEWAFARGRILIGSRSNLPEKNLRESIQECNGLKKGQRRSLLLLGHDSSTVGFATRLCPPTRFFLKSPLTRRDFLAQLSVDTDPSLSYIYYGYPTNASDEGKRANGEEHVAEEWEDGDIPAHNSHSRTNTEDYTDI